MCKWLSNILFPLEIFNRKRNIVTWNKPYGAMTVQVSYLDYVNRPSKLIVKYGNTTYQQTTPFHSYNVSPNEMDFTFICTNIKSITVNGTKIL